MELCYASEFAKKVERNDLTAEMTSDVSQAGGVWCSAESIGAMLKVLDSYPEALQKIRAQMEEEREMRRVIEERKR